MTPNQHHRLLPLLSIGLLACGPELPEVPDTEHGRTFLSERVFEGGIPRQLVAGTRLSLGFYEAMDDTSHTGDTGSTSDTSDADDMPDTWIGAEAGCNEAHSPYTIDEDTLFVSPLYPTLIGCDDARSEQDDWYFTFLESRPSLALAGHALVLEGDGTRIEYLDEAVATPDLELAGHVWTVDSIIEDGVVTRLEWPRPATFVFDANATEYARGGVAIDTGCNTGFASYRTFDWELSFIDVTMTQHACEGEAARLEDAVLDLFYWSSEPMRHKITIDRLWLRGPVSELELIASTR
jgi:heat shock protein HslJ